MTSVLEPAIPAPAATALVVVPASNGVEVLMVRRPLRGEFAGAWVFPGGTVDDSDRYPDDGAAGNPKPGEPQPGEPEPGNPGYGDASPDPSYRRAAARELAEEVGIVVASESLALISRWITPEVYPRRFDTHFFLAPMDGPRDLVLAAAELEEATYVTPEAALEAHNAELWELVLPTLAHLRWLSRFVTVEEAVAATGRARTPRPSDLADDGSIVPMDLPW